MPISLTNAAQALQTTFHECADIAQEQSQVIRRNRKFSAQTLASTFVLGLLTNSRACLLYTSPSPRDLSTSRMPSSA